MPKSALALAVALALPGATTPALVVAQDEASEAATQREQVQFDIPAGSLAAALRRFGEAAGLALTFEPSVAEGKRTDGLAGQYAPRDALRRLLADTGLRARFVDAATVRVVEAGDERLGEIVVEAAPSALAPAADPIEGYDAEYSRSLTRTATKRRETPASIDVVTRDFIDDTGAGSRDEALEQVPGVARGTTIRGEQDFSIRGFAVPETAQEINSLSVRSARPLDLGVVERIEVARGPTSIINGATSPGGTINVITKRPQPESFGRFQQEAGSYGLFRSVVDANGALDSDGDAFGRVVAVNTPDTGNFVDDTEGSEITLAPSLSIDTFGGAGRLRLTGLHQDFEGTSYRGVPLIEGGGAPDIDPETNVGGGDDNGAFDDFEANYAQIEYDHEFVEGLELTGRLGHQDTDQQVNDIYAFQFGGPIPASGDTNIYASERTLDKESTAAELFVTQTFGAGETRHELVAGVDYRDQERDATLGFAGPNADNIFDLENDFTVPATGFTPFTDRTFTLEQTGAFIQGVTRPTTRLTLSGGVRYDQAEFTNRARVRGENADIDASEDTGRLGVSYAITSGLNVYTAYQDSFNVQSDLKSDGELVPPETGENLEIGIKADVLSSGLQVSAAAFRTDRRNVATQDPDNPGFSVVTGEQRHEGFELAINGDITSAWRVSGQWSVLDAEITESNEGVEGNSPAGVPQDYVGRVFTLYQPDAGTLSGWGFGGGVFFHSGFVVDRANEFETDAYERLDLVATYEWSEALDFQLNVRNVTDEVYIQSPGVVSSNNQFGAPRTFKGSLRYRF